VSVIEPIINHSSSFNANIKNMLALPLRPHTSSWRGGQAER